MYRTPARSAVGAGAFPRRAPRGAALPLRFATIGVNQFGGGSSRKSDIRPSFCRVTGFERRTNHARGDELVEAAWRAPGFRARRNELRDDSAMRGDRNTFACLNPPYVAAQVVFELTNACRCHRSNYSHMWPHQQAGCADHLHGGDESGSNCDTVVSAWQTGWLCPRPGPPALHGRPTMARFDAATKVMRRALTRLQNVSKTREDSGGLTRTAADESRSVTDEEASLIAKSRAPSTIYKHALKGFDPRSPLH